MKTSNLVPPLRRCARPVALMLTLALGGCAKPHPAVSPALTESARNEIYSRAALEFAGATLFKPPAPQSPDPMPHALAPLILQENRGGEAGGQQDRLVGISFSNHKPVADTNTPTVYYWTNQTLVRGRPYQRYTYLWAYPAAGRTNAGSGLSVQGFRLTLDSAGRPAIAEVLADGTGVRVFFVSQSLETAAATEFGEPLPGRRSSVERKVADAPDVLVARVISDGPAPMGPIVYVRTGTHDVATLICRCMPAQVKELTGQSEYELTPVSVATAERLLANTRWQNELRGDSGPGRLDLSRLEERLRLPDDF